MSGQRVVAADVAVKVIALLLPDEFHVSEWYCYKNVVNHHQGRNMKHRVSALAFCLFSGAAMASEPVEYQTKLAFSPDNSALTAVTTLEIPVEQITNGAVALFLNQNFSVKSVTGENISSFDIGQSNKVPVWNEVIIKFSEAGNSKPQSVRIEYAGSIDNEAQHGNFITANDLHLSIDSAWHPVFSDFSTPITGTVSVELGDDWQVFGPGTVTRSERSYQISSEHPTIDVSLYAEKQPARLDKEGFTVVHDGSNAEMAELVSRTGLQCFKQMNQRFGKLAPLESAQTVLLKRAGPSFARGNYISLSIQNLGADVHTHQYLCHELAHNWTSYTSAMSHDYWLVESFAEYISAQEIERVYGEQAFNNIVKGWQSRAKGETFVWRSDIDRRASHKVNYGLGPIALMKLQDKLGETDFNELVDWYMANDVIETEALLTKIASLADADTERWFRDLLAGS